MQKQEIINLLKKHRLKPKKYLGQNFIVNDKTMEKMTEAAGLEIEDNVLEIGSGIGNLTREIAKKANKVLAVEKDKELVETSQELLSGYKNVKIVTNNVLKDDKISSQVLSNLREFCKPSELKYKIIANLPYYISSPVVRKFLETSYSPSSMTLMLQKEVAERICAQPPHMNFLALWVQFYGSANIVKSIKKGNFWPVPRVEHAIVNIFPKNYSHSKQINREELFKIIEAGFSNPRKKVKNNLKKHLFQKEEDIALQTIEKAGIKGDRRPETLSLEEWIEIYKQMKKSSW